MSNVTIVEHPLVAHHLTRLRAKTTGPDEFRQLVRRLATLLAYEATKDLSVEAIQVATPMAEATGSRVNARVGLVPILRAGLGMVDPMLDLLPESEVWHLGLYRDEKTAEPVEYYSRLPKGRPVDVGLVIDPMLATGGSASSALAALRDWGVPRTKLLSILAASEGVDLIAKRYPETQLYVCAVDLRLDENKFIVPGLGDAGDRIFHTLP
jgi:uracil phosphoribosyltransferase